VVTPGGIFLYRLFEGGEEVLPELSAEDGARVRALLRALDSDSPQEREEATQALFPLSFRARALLEDASAAASDPELRERLRRILTALPEHMPALVRTPLQAGRRWTAQIGPRTFECAVLEETEIVTGLGPRRVWLVRAEAPDRILRTWFDPVSGPLVRQETDRSTGRTVEWRIERLEQGR
jgi:hypothetical protein